MKYKIIILLAGLFIPFGIEAQTISVNPATLDCGSVLSSESSAGTHNFNISADDALGAGDGGGATVIHADGNAEFKIALASTGPWGEELLFDTDDNGDLPLTTIYVKFTPAARGNRSFNIFVYEENFNCDGEIVVSGIGVYPEIEVRGNSLVINDEDNTPSETDHTDFGGAAYPGGYIDRTFTIYNVAGTSSFDGDLKLTGSTKVVVGGANASDFSVTAMPSTPVGRDGGSTTFTVRFSPSASGVRNATLSIANNDLNENPYNFSIRGTGAVPEIDVRGDGLSIVDGDATPSLTDFTDFGNIDLCFGTQTRTFYIHNTGGAALSLTDHDAPNGQYVWITGTNAAYFTVDIQPSTPVSASSSTSFQVTYNPNGVGVHTAEVHVLSDDADEGEYNFTISGTGVTPEIDIQSASASIVNNDNTPSVTDSTDFGGVDVAGTNSIISTFTIFNLNAGSYPGNLCLIDGSPYVVISGTHASDFTLTQIPSTPIGVGMSTKFKITFDPSGLGIRSASISIASNDLDENPYTFAIQGTGATIPTVSTTSISSISSSGASTGGNITNQGGLTVSARGVCYGTEINPDLGGLFTTNGTGGGVYSSTLSALAQATHYFVRAYATNSIGTGYGMNKAFWTLATEPAAHPSSPAVVTKTQNSITFNWSAASGATGYMILQKTGLTAPNNTNVFDGLAPVELSLPGGTTLAGQTTGTEITINSLALGTDYSFAIIPFGVGSNDSTYNYKTDGTLTTITARTLKNAPVTQAYNLVFSVIQTTSFNVEWTRGNGDSCLVVVHEGAAIDADPVNGTIYSAGTSAFNDGTQIGTGNYVAYKGTGTSLSITGLSSGTTYYFKVYEFNNGGINSLFLTSNATNNPRSQATIKPTPTVQDYDLVFSAVSTTTLTLSWSKGNGDNSLVIASVGNNLTNPVDNTSYTASAVFGSGAQTGTGCYVIYKGTGSTVNVTNLATNTNYYFKVIAFNNPGTSYPKYLTTAASNNPSNVTTLKNAPTTQASTLVFSNVKSSTMTVGWTRGNGEYTMLIAKQGGAVTNPSDNTTYTASSVFGSGSQIGTDTYVLYTGNDANPSVNISGLSRNNTYYFKAIEYNNHGTAYIKYNTSSASGNPNSVLALTTAPTTQSTSGSALNIDFNAADLNWTSGNGQQRLVIVKQGSAVDQLPVNGTGYTAGAFGTGSELGTGNFVVYSGTSNSFNLTGLSQNVTYYARIFEFNETGADAEYLTSTASGNPFSFTTIKEPPSTQATNIVFSDKTAHSFTISWTNGNGEKRVVLLNTTNSFTVPSDGTDPIANTLWQNAGQQVVYNGTGNTLGVTGLSSLTTYYARVYEYNNSGVSSRYLNSTGTGNPNSDITLSQLIEASGSGDWTNPALWGGVVPGPGDDVVIGAGITITIPSGKASAECNDLTLNPLANLNVDGSLHVHGNFLVQSNATGSGSVIDKGSMVIDGTKSIEIYIAQSDRYYYISTPLTGITATVFGDIAGTELVYKRNTASAAWERITTNESLNVGQGYAVKLTGAPKTITLTGSAVTTGNFNPILVNSGDKWNLVGNPYPSPVDWGTGASPVVTFSNIRNVVYIKHGVNFAYWLPENNGGAGESLNDGSRYIPAHQAYWIKVLADGAAINLTDNTRVHNGNLLLKEPEVYNQKLRIKATRGEYSDEALLGFSADAQDWSDKYDAEKMFAMENICPQIYMMVENEKMAVATHAPFTGVYLQPLCFRTGVSGHFTYTFTGAESFGPLSVLYLEDKYAGKIVNISENPVYAFESATGDFTNRFIIHISDGTSHYNPYDQGSASGIDLKLLHVKVYGYGNLINIKCDKALKATVKVYNLVGSELRSVEMNGTFLEIEIENPGTHIVKVIASNNSLVKKIFLK